MEKVSAGSVSNTVQLSALQPFFSVLLHIPVSREGHWPGSDPLPFLTLKGVSANKYCFVLLCIFKHCLVLIFINRFATSSLVNFESSPLYLDLYNIPKGAQSNSIPQDYLDQNTNNSLQVDGTNNSSIVKLINTDSDHCPISDKQVGLFLIPLI